MIYVTGDIHGGHDISKLNTSFFPEQKQMTKSDYVIVCGDFGLVWHDCEEERYWLDWLEKKNFTTLWVDGNHENFDRLETLPVNEWNGGLVQEVRPSILHLMRGSIFDIDGVSILAMGGATSHDKWARKIRESWWQQEEITSMDMRAAARNLAKRNWKVDYVVSHCAPAHIEKALADWFEAGPSSYYLKDLSENVKFRHWYCGHYHMDMFNVQNKYTVLYHMVHKLNLEE